MGKSHSRRVGTLAVVATMVASLVIVPGGVANAADTTAVDRAAVVAMWRSGGDVLAPAARAALLGTDDDVQAFLGQVTALQGVDDRVRVNRILSSSGTAVRAQAQAALDSGNVAGFLTNGWQVALHTDERIRVNQMLSAGGTQLQAAAQKALDADATAGPVADDDDPGDSPSGPLDTFIATGWQKPFEIDQRITVNHVLDAAPAGSNVARLAQRALDAGTVDALTSFLDTQQAIGAARDEEAATITDLVQSTERAGEQTQQLTVTAKQQGAKATAAATAAKASALQAVTDMKNAGSDARKAAAAAARGAAAAKDAAHAATEAASAAQAAVSAARAAAAAAARAATTAALTRAAANAADSAAAEAAVDKTKSDAAKALAANAQKCAKLSGDAAYAVGRAQEVTADLILVAQAATDASVEADKAAQDTQTALAQARATGVNVADAEASAARASHQANRANRAAAASLGFAKAAYKAAGDARNAANKATTDANAAAGAANDAVAHAGDATRAAQASTTAANAATVAADDAVSTANDAYAVYNAARAVDDQYLKVATEEYSEQAHTELAAYQRFQKTVDWNTQEAAKRDTDTNTLITAVRDPGTDQVTAVTDSRQAAMNLAQSGGPNTRQEAITALGGSDAEVLDFVRTRIDAAAAADDRANVQTIAATAESPNLRAAALTALAGTDAEVTQLLRTQDYPQRATEERIKINQILDQAQKSGDAATASQAQAALDGSAQDRHQFITTGQYQSAGNNDRIIALRMLNDDASGAHLKAATQNALDGAPGGLHEFITTGWYTAQQDDDDADVHNNEMLALLQRASNAASTATRTADQAQVVAAHARGDAKTADTWATKAVTAAQQATTYAHQADQSAANAEKSAAHALTSAQQAATAAKTASDASDQANQAVAAARSSNDQAHTDAARAVKAGQDAQASAVAAGKNVTEALKIRDDTITYRDQLLQNEQNKRLEAVHHQLAQCLTNSLPGAERNCYKVYQPSDVRLAEATENKAFCNNFASTDSVYYHSCVADTFNPNFGTNRALDILFAGTIAFTVWVGSAAAAIGLVALAATCAELCGAVLAVALGPEASLGVGGLYEGWAQGTLLNYVARAAGTGTLAGINNAIKSAVNEIRIPAIFERITVPEQAIDANFARLISENRLPSCLHNSFAAGTPVLLANRTTKPIETVAIGDQVLATDPTTGTTQPEPVTALHNNLDTELTDITVDTPSGHQTIFTTPGHKFWDQTTHDWTPADHLQPGETLLAAEKNQAPHIVATRSYAGSREMHNLTIANIHTYYILAGNTPVLVHNCNSLVDDALSFSGAHVLDEHVNVTADQAVRLARTKGGPNPDSGINSVFIDLQTAQQVVDYAVAGNGRRIANWLRGNDQQLPLRGRFGARNSIGTAYRGDGSSSPTGNGWFILFQRAPGHSRGYYIQTAYPE